MPQERNVDDAITSNRIYHMADKINPRGKVSALCFETPHAIRGRDMWTLMPKAVTCEKCLKILAEKSINK